MSGMIAPKIFGPRLEAARIVVFLLVDHFEISHEVMVIVTP